MIQSLNVLQRINISINSYSDDNNNKGHNILYAINQNKLTFSADMFILYLQTLSSKVLWESVELYSEGS